METARCIKQDSPGSPPRRKNIFIGGIMMLDSSCSIAEQQE